MFDMITKFFNWTQSQGGSWIETDYCTNTHVAEQHIIINHVGTNTNHDTVIVSGGEIISIFVSLLFWFRSQTTNLAVTFK